MKSTVSDQVTSNPVIENLEPKVVSYADIVNGYAMHESHIQAPAHLMHQALNDFDYSKLESILLVHLDYLDGVKSSILLDPAKTTYPTGVAFIRDSSDSLKLEDRHLPEDPVIMGNNLLLRALGTIRGIDHVLKHKADLDGYEIYEEARMKLQLYMRELIMEIGEHDKVFDNEILNSVHRKFNLKLSALLHETNLNNDLESPQQHAKLFAHYRDLASVLDPAKTMVTIRREEKDEVERIFTETSYPVTTKTAVQKKQLDAMLNIKMIADGLTALNQEEENDAEEESDIFTPETQLETAEPDANLSGSNYHAAKPVAFQIVDEAFVDLIKQDDRRLPAQTRYTVAPTIKNGYVVHNEIELKKAGVSIAHADNWSLRAATVAYIGAGETATQLIAYAKQNLIQLLQVAKKIIPSPKMKFNFGMLLTDTSWGKQDKMIKITQDAIQALAPELVLQNQQLQYSYLPINILGTPNAMTFSDIITESATQANITLPSTGSDFTDKSSRITKVGKVFALLSNSNDAINICACASGQDRTGTAQEVSSLMWETDQLQKLYHDNHEILGAIDNSALFQDVMLSRARACNNAVLGTLSTPGSTGMKNDSRPDDFFPAIINKFYYRKTAKTNKAPPISKEQIERLYLPNVTKESLRATFDAALDTIQNNSDPKIILISLTTWAETALRYQQLKEPKGIRGKLSDSIAKTFRFGLFSETEREKARGMRNIATEMVAYLRDQKVLTKPTDIQSMITSLGKWRDDNNEKYPKDAKRGTVIRHLFELSHAAAVQIGVAKTQARRQ